MTDVEMTGGASLGSVSSSHSHLADRINGGAMDVQSLADSTATGRLSVLVPSTRPAAC
jgi:regulator of ribosome biosynthesis